VKDVNDERVDPPLGDELDLDAWEPQLPSAGFAERVLERIQSADTVSRASERRDGAPSHEAPSAPRAVVKSRRRWAAASAGVAAFALAAAVLLRVGGPPAHGEAIARERTEVAIGSRALAVLEPGANVRWNGDDVTQSRGDVFYRVEPGARFIVHTPAGDVEVKGTCFTVKVRPIGPDGREETDMQKRDVKSGAVGAALSALAFVAVYEGKVAVSHASEHIDLRAGETAQTGPGGVKRTGATGEGEKAFEANVAAADDDPLGKANQNLVRQVGEYRSRLEAITAQKAELEAKLKRSEASLTASQDGAPAVMKHDFDLSQDDWKELAKNGTIKYQMPCVNTKNEPWSPSPEKLNALGLAPQDAATIKDAYAHSSQRVWGTIKPLCAQAVGSADLAERIGPSTCIHLVVDIERDKGKGSVEEAMRQVGEIRAGTRPMPGPNEPSSPVAKLFLATTGASKDFEAELAQSFGPDEAHRIVYSDELCMGSHTYGGGERRPPKK
jgi:ferric-dicitrate binding protein FerR (iron transport regulator)